jgi:hypothetical protein
MAGDHQDGKNDESGSGRPPCLRSFVTGTFLPALAEEKATYERQTQVCGLRDLQPQEDRDKSHSPATSSVIQGSDKRYGLFIPRQFDPFHAHTLLELELREH